MVLVVPIINTKPLASHANKMATVVRISRRETVMRKNKYIYAFSYDNAESELCKLESRYLFNKEEKNKQLISDVKVEPSRSAFVKKRVEVLLCSEDYAALINNIKNERICIDGFKVEYLVFDGDPTAYADRLIKLKDVGYCIEGTPDYYHPTTTYAICYCEGAWYFGVLIKDRFDWHKHKQKPYSYSNSIGVNTAKALVNIAANTNNEISLLDACCGVGTIMLEACFSGNNIEGCDINWKACKHARGNLAHFNYTAKVYRSDIKDINTRYDAAIVDLPYNLFSSATSDDILHIIGSTAAVSDRLVIVSISDISTIISQAGLRMLESCSVGKSGKTNFARKVWVCDKPALN